MSDIVERLRDVAGSGSSLAREAAAEIERLRAENERLQAALQRALDPTWPVSKTDTQTIAPDKPAD